MIALESRGPVPTQAELVPNTIENVLPVEPVTGTHACLDCSVTWVSTTGDSQACWTCGEEGRLVRAAEDMLGRPIIPRIWKGATRQDMSLSEGDYCCEREAA